LLPIEATVIEMIPVRFLIEEQDYMDEQIIDSGYKENMRWEIQRCFLETLGIMLRLDKWILRVPFVTLISTMKF